MRYRLGIVCGVAMWLIGMVGLQAQTALLRIQWDANPAGEQVIGYHLYVDTLPVIVVPPMVTASCGCIESAQPFLSGPHVVRVAAVNLALSTDPMSEQEGPALMMTFTVNAKVDVRNIRIVK